MAIECDVRPRWACWARACPSLGLLGLPHEPAKLEPARLDQPDFWPTGPPDEDSCEPPPPIEWDQRSPYDALT